MFHLSRPELTFLGYLCFLPKGLCFGWENPFLYLPFRSIKSVTIRVHKSIKYYKSQAEDGMFIGLDFVVQATEPYYSFEPKEAKRPMIFRRLPATQKAFDGIREYCKSHAISLAMTQWVWRDYEADEFYKESYLTGAPLYPT